MTKRENLLTLEEAAKYLASSKTSLRRWTNDGILACRRVGLRGERRFEREALDDFLHARSPGTARPEALRSAYVVAAHR